MPWTNEPPLGLARVGLASATCDAPVPESGYRIYAIGGYDGVSVVPTVEAYDTVART
jgi:Kelch motif